ncbi:RloB domain-containing protein [Bacteroides sp. 214]|uniref:RloB family protein n=1 Tax=Bacteroides sp. 214 TaxID=2302935 RepID=UPI0013D0C8F8|nr:RloB family protein [Bacteroides sp. 214]NDW11976.1 RloB domain-containing protein [Bacteroides sp. 214]
MARRGKITNKQERDVIERPVRYKKYLQFFLIVCEDQNTEPTYFKQFISLFPENTLFLKTVGTGLSPKGVVERAIIERDNFEKVTLKEIDFVWAVFDKDDADLVGANGSMAKKENFEEAFTVAAKESIEIAYSNEVFELWLLLHLKNVSASVAIPRQDIYAELEQSVKKTTPYQNFVYQHGNSDIIDIIAKIGNEDAALKRAAKILEQQKDKEPIDANPSTKVHLLVKELRDWIGYYNYKPS